MNQPKVQDLDYINFLLATPRVVLVGLLTAALTGWLFLAWAVMSLVYSSMPHAQLPRASVWSHSLNAV